jgi:hypothetical protein
MELMFSEVWHYCRWKWKPKHCAEETKPWAMRESESVLWICEKGTFRGVGTMGVRSGSIEPRFRTSRVSLQSSGNPSFTVDVINLAVHSLFLLHTVLNSNVHIHGPPLWSSGQSFWVQIQRSWVRFPVLPDFLRSRGSGTGSTQPRGYNWGATWMKK